MAASRSRTTLARIAAPIAFLLAVTIAVLLVRAGLNDADSRAPAGGGPAATTRQPAGPRYYVVSAGDTLGAIARRFDSTVAELVRLNPGIDPVGLRVGDRIRVR